MSDFSLALNEDQLTLQKWLHEFVDVMRPNAEEDEREEFPADRRAGRRDRLYSWEFMAEMMMNDSTGISMVMAIEEIFWRCGSAWPSWLGSRRRRHRRLRHPRGGHEWVPQCYSDGSKINTGAFAASEPDAGSDVNGYRLAKYDEAKDEWVLNGTKAWITNGGMADIHVVVAVVDPELGSKRHASFIVLPGTAGLTQGQKYKKHGIKASHTAEVVLDDVRSGPLSLGGKEKLDERLARGNG